MSTTQNETAVRSIEDTIRVALNDRGALTYYDSYARPIVATLVERETEMSTKLVDFAVDQGAEPGEIRAYLQEIGMAVAADPEPEAEDEEDEEDEEGTPRLESLLTALTEKVDSLADFARRNGYRG